MHHTEPIVFYIFVIFAGSAILATLMLYARQSLLVGYILLGVMLGPSGLAIVSNTAIISSIADIGIIFLLFLLGLNLQPQGLLHLLRKTVAVTVASSLVFAFLGYVIARIFGFNELESVLIGIATTFSSTIIGLKLLPTTILHHRHAGEVIVSVLLLQDLFAITMLLILQGFGKGGTSFAEIGLLVIALPLLIGFTFIFQRYVLIKLIRRFDKIQEYIFLMTIGWCLGTAQLAKALGLSYEIGAFIGGVAMASSLISRFIAESLKPLRDFFLVIFFFSLGASLKLGILYEVLLPATLLAVVLLSVKPFVFKILLMQVGEPADSALEIGFRLGQISEFSLLIAVVALSVEMIGDSASYLIQAATVITFIVSSYLVVLRYPTPIAVSDRLRRD